MTSALWSIPVFITSAPMSSNTTVICWRKNEVGTSSTLKTPFVFWEVKAVMAVAAKHPRAVTVLISACIPAPPLNQNQHISKRDHS